MLDVLNLLSCVFSKDAYIFIFIWNALGQVGCILVESKVLGYINFNCICKSLGFTFFKTRLVRTGEYNKKQHDHQCFWCWGSLQSWNVDTIWHLHPQSYQCCRGKSFCSTGWVRADRAQNSLQMHIAGAKSVIGFEIFGCCTLISRN